MAEKNQILVRGGDVEVGLDTVFQLLSHRHRRIMLNYLRRHPDDWIPRDELADHIVQWERELDAVGRPEDVAINLAHRHLPALESAGVIEVDDQQDLVAYRPSDRVDRFLELSAREGPVP